MDFIKNSPRLTIGIIIFIIIVFGVYRVYTSKYLAKTYFDDPKVIALCNATKKGDTDKVNELLNAGVNINTTGKDNFTPLSWLFYTQKQRNNPKVKIGFKHLLEKGADPSQGENEKLWPVFHATARYEDPIYLKMILEKGIENIDMEMKNDSSPTPLLQAMMAGRFENFKMLLDYGADIEWQGAFGRTPLTEVGSSDGWRYSWLLLQRGADYTINTEGSKNEPNIISVLEGIMYHPSGGFDAEPDYRQLVIEFLREKGVEVSPWMPEDEKYVLKSEEKINQLKVDQQVGNRLNELKSELYIFEKVDGSDKKQWVKFKDSTRYEADNYDPDKQK